MRFGAGWAKSDAHRQSPMAHGLPQKLEERLRWKRPADGVLAGRMALDPVQTVQRVDVIGSTSRAALSRRSKVAVPTRHAL